MIQKIVLLFIYMIVLPISIGVTIQILPWQNYRNKDIHILTKIVDIYVSGILGCMFLFEVSCKLMLIATSTYSDLCSVWKMILGLLVSILLVYILGTFWVLYRKKLLKRIAIKMEKQDLYLLFLSLIYILVSVLFMLPNSADNTIPVMCSIKAHDFVAVFDSNRGLQLDDIAGHTKLIEVFYLAYADCTGIGYVKFVEYIVNLFWLLVFFGIYKRIETIFINYNKELLLERGYIEGAFFALCFALMFIQGSLAISIPQNIWNGQTFFCACILPLCFTYGYGAVCEFEKKELFKALKWFGKMFVMMPIAALMSDSGYQFVLLELITAMVVIILRIVIKKYRATNSIKDRGNNQ